MPEGRDGGRGGKPFSRATSSRNTWFSARSAVIVACCASSASRRAALSDRNRRTSTTSTPTRSRSSASERASSDAVSGSDMRPVDHATAPSATSTPRNLPRLRLFPDGRHLLLQAPVEPNVPERQSEQNGPEASRDVERGPFERTAAMVMDADADEERQANGQAQRDASWAECANEPARKRNQEHQGCGDPAILASKAAEKERHGGDDGVERHGCEAAAIRATHVDHGGVQGPDHDEVGQRSQAECGKSNEG